MKFTVVILVVLSSAVTVRTSGESETRSDITWKLYEVTPTESAQVTLLRTLVSWYPNELFINGEIREDETSFFLMRAAVEDDILNDFKDARIPHSSYPQRQIKKPLPVKHQTNIFGVFGDDDYISAYD